MLDDNELLFDELYEKTKDCGRVHFINLLMEKERENQELKKQLEEKENQQKEFIDWLTNESKELIRDAGYHQRICLDILSKYKEIIGGNNE